MLRLDVLHAWAVMMIQRILYTDCMPGAYLAVARHKDPCRAFATGLSGWGNEFNSILGAQDTEARMVAGLPHAPACPDHEHLVALGALYQLYLPRIGLDRLSLDEQVLELARAVYMELLVVLQPGNPYAEYIGLDVPAIALDVGMSLDDLYALADREALRPGCQFGVRLWLAREAARRLVVKAQEAAHEAKKARR